MVFEYKIIHYDLHQIAELKVTIDGLEKERDFYFGKLRDMEVYCQENEESDHDAKAIVTGIMGILYATEVQHPPHSYCMYLGQSYMCVYPWHTK